MFGLVRYLLIPFAVGTYLFAGINFFEERVTVAELKEKYKNSEIRILIVPGHDKINYGTQYRGITESSLNAVLGNQLYEFLRNEKKFTVFITNKSAGEYNDWILDYSRTAEPAILAFKENLKNVFREALKSGIVKRKTVVKHNPAADNTSKMLYAINKWANDNSIDIVIHIHINDYPGRKYDMPGKYKGFAIYTPEEVLPNSEASRAIAESIKKELKKISESSTYPKEKSGVVEDQQLIAVGANASRDGASILIEYGYIYEPRFIDKVKRPWTLYDSAEATYRGLKTFFEK